MRRAKGIIPLLLITVFASLASFAFASISFDGGGIKYVPANKGDILFSIDYGASKMYFDNGFLMLNNLNGIFSSIGFSCDTETANMTITKIDSLEIDYTVNAPTSTTSTTKIYAGSKGKPSNVTGCSSWSYNNILKILSVDAFHNSPTYIVVEWENVEGDTVQDFINRTYLPSVDMFGVVLIIIAAVLIFSAMNEIPVDINLIVQAVLVTIILSMGIYIFSYFRF